MSTYNPSIFKNERECRKHRVETAKLVELTEKQFRAIDKCRV